MRFSKQWILVLLPLLLTGCSREPSEQALKEVYEKSLAETNAVTTQMGGKHMRIELKTFKKISCSDMNSSDQYLCKIEVNLQAPIIGSQTQQGEITVQKEHGDWILIHD